jgi:hypothetical protein
MKIDQKAQHIEDLFLFIGLFSLFSVSSHAKRWLSLVIVAHPNHHEIVFLQKT